MNYAAFAGKPELVPSSKFKVYTEKHLDQINPNWMPFPGRLRHEVRVVARILPFRVNQYVLDQLVDWENAETDPIFLLTFPQKDMLEPEAFDRMARLMRNRRRPLKSIHATGSTDSPATQPSPCRTNGTEYPGSG